MALRNAAFRPARPTARQDETDDIPIRVPAPRAVRGARIRPSCAHVGVTRLMIG